MEAFIILLIFVGTIALIASPFLKKATEIWETSAVDSKMNKLTASKDSLYKAIKDVDFEFAEGKLSETDYNELRGYYKEKAVMTIKEMDKIKSGQKSEVRSQKDTKGKKEHR